MPASAVAGPTASASASPAIQRLCDGCAREEEEVRRKCAACEAEEETIRRQEAHEEELIQSKRDAGARPPTVTSAVASGIDALRGGGRPLSADLRTFFESRFGVDFSPVRVHTGQRAAETAKAVNARAYTVGHDIAFAAGEYAPATAAGRHLLAHELTHVRQQTGDRPGPQGRIQRLPNESDLACETAPMPTPAEWYADPFLARIRADPPGANNYLLRTGAVGPTVDLVQRALVAWGCDRGLGYLLPRFGVDGIFGSETRGAVKKFQGARGIDVDGIVGPITVGELDAVVGAQTPQPQELPPCPLEPFQQASFVGGPQPTKPLAFGIPGVTCQPKGLAKDAIDLARVHKVKLNTFPQDVTRRWASAGKVETSGQLLAEASAELLPGTSPAADFSFGFIQVCRPYDVVRATYRKRGALAGTGNDLDWTATMRIRQGKMQGTKVIRPPLPALDVGVGHEFSEATPASEKSIRQGKIPPPVQSVKPKKGKVPVLTFTDTPRQVFKDAQFRAGDIYDIEAFSWQSHFFLAYVVKLPSGKIEPLKTCFWSAKDCMTDAWMLLGNTTAKTVGKVEVTTVRDCFKHHCDRGEPGFEKAGTTPSKGETCNEINAAAQAATPVEGPDNYKLTCPP